MEACRALPCRLLRGRRRAVRSRAALTADSRSDSADVLIALIHGGMDRASSFAAVARILNGEGYEVLTYDRAGYASAVEEEPFTDVRDAASDLLARVGARPAVAIGHSFGGHLAMLAALSRPDVVRAVGVFETPFLWQPFWPDDTSGGKAALAARAGGTEAAAEAFLRNLVGDATWAKLPPSTKALRRAEGRALIADLASVTDEAPYDPPDLRVPLVVGRGSNALPHQVRGTDWIVSQVPTAELVVIDGAGHGAHRTHPEAFAEFVLRAVARASATPNPSNPSNPPTARNPPTPSEKPT